MPNATALGTLNNLRERAAEVAATLTPQEKGVVDYHRNNLKLRVTHNGKPMTALMVGPRIMSGTHEGKYASVPSFVPGVNNNKPMTEDQALDYWLVAVEFKVL